VNLVFFSFSFSFFIFILIYFSFFFIFRTQGLGIEVIGHTVTSDGVVTTLIMELKEKEAEDSETK